MVVHGRISKPLPPLVQGIERKSWLKLLGIIFQENPSDWDLHVDNLLRKASSRLYILRVCKYFGYPKEQLTKLFHLLIMSLFLQWIEIWGAAYQGKYLDCIDKFFKRAFRFRYTNNLYAIAEVIKNRDGKLGTLSWILLPIPFTNYYPLRNRDFCKTEGMIGSGPFLPPPPHTAAPPRSSSRNPHNGTTRTCYSLLARDVPGHSWYEREMRRLQ